jgi:hypothetical protein
LKKATRPLEYICFFPAEIPARIDGDVFAFIFVDVYSDFVIMTGLEKSKSNETILGHIRLLTRNKDFLKHKGVPFTLVLHKYEEILDDILSIIKPFKGKGLIDDAFVAEKVTPVLESLFTSMAGKVKPDKSFLN